MYLYAEYEIDYSQVTTAIIISVITLLFIIFLIVFLINKYKKANLLITNNNNNNNKLSESVIDESIYCRKCGKKLDKNSVCCNYCGEKIVEVDNKLNNTNYILFYLKIYTINIAINN